MASSGVDGVYHALSPRVSGIRAWRPTGRSHISSRGWAGAPTSDDGIVPVDQYYSTCWFMRHGDDNDSCVSEGHVRLRLALALVDLGGVTGLSTLVLEVAQDALH